ncbi:Bacteriophage replication protein O [Serratia entomophila]|nr:Bacteriophage replication protein O [Serratia entomophila]CAI0870680.1 Bacteriophage replication protein O [Serratia entomophila]CAI0897335.1 Bacteriophage replication protein O [Serratia entomophila]CAI1057394.1 Bacteriophage replication protein O [Serratia entomophila]CAI1076882.1 Bacteriophage replication protein O [Serratia entomophila]
MSTAKFYDLSAERERRSNRMENQKLGYVPLYRSIKKKPWAKDVYLRTLWENLLLEAQRQPRTVNFKGNQWNLQAGQLVVTAADLGLSLCDRDGKPTSRDAVGRMLSFFAKEGMISIDGEKRKGTVITILNYSEYAEKIDNLPAHKSAQIPAHSEASNGAGSNGGAAHKSAQIPAHHEQEGNNKNIKRLSSENSGESSNARLEKFLSAHPDAFVYSPTGAKWGTEDDEKACRWMYSQILTVNAAAKEPTWADWANAVRLMRQQDDLTHKEICEVFRWANRDVFWCSNILSPAKLREKWGTLSAQKGQPNRKQRPDAEPVPHWNSRESWEEFI